jgi:acyl carrier protein
VTDEEAFHLLSDLLAKIAPEIDLAVVDRDADIQEELDLDSIDFLNLVEAIHERTGLEIPESDYPKLSSLNSSARYLAATAP